MRPDFHEDYNRERETRGGSDRSFGIVMGLFFLFLGLWPLRSHHGVRVWALALAAIFVAAALVLPKWLRPLNRAWTALGLWIGMITTPVIAGLLFFLAVTPTAIIMRLFRKDPLRLRFDSAASSYWILRTPPGPPPESMQNQF